MAMIKSVAHRRYLVRMALFMGSYLLILFGVATRFHNGGVGTAEAYILGILPALPIIGVFWSIGRLLVEESDEFLRMLMIRQTLWASGFALSIATVWGFLESFDMVGHVEAFYVAVLWFGGLGLGALANRLTFGGGAA